MTKKVALGKGIASLIKQNPSQILSPSLTFKDEGNKEIEKGVILVDVASIHSNPYQPRRIFKERDLEELAESIFENGIIQPLIVSERENGLELIAGERRLKAAKLARLEKVPVIVKKRVTEREKMVMAIIENVQRSDLNCIEEALAYFKLMNNFNLSQEEVAKKLGKERSGVANYLRLLKLPRKVVEMLQREQLSFGHGKVLAVIKEQEEAIALAKKAVEQALSVRELEDLVSSSKDKDNKSPPHKNPKDNNSRWNHLRQELEQKTGFHVAIKTKRNGAGHISVKFNDEAEFNRIYEFLLAMG